MYHTATSPHTTYETILLALLVLLMPNGAATSATGATVTTSGARESKREGEGDGMRLTKVRLC